MAIEILMPALSPTMEEGTLSKWMKKEGDTVEAGDIIAEIETDKATMEMEAVDEGVMGKILIAEGTDNVAVNKPIAILLEEGEDASAADSAKSAAPAPPAPAAEPEPAPAPAASAAPTPPAPAPAAAAPSGDRVFASPLAKRMAANAGIDLSAVQGSGPNGRIVKVDVEAAISGGVAQPAAAAPAATPAPAAKAAAAPPPVSELDPFTEVKNNSMRKVIAQRLGESKFTSPHYYLTIDVELDKLLALRKELNAKAPEVDGKPEYKVSVNDFIIKACALALRKVPQANSVWTDEAIRLYDDVNISVAVATDGGLITPIIRHADQKGLATISNEMRELGLKARDGKLMPEEYQGGGFSISNMGMMGIKQFTSIINPPQSCILAVGAGEQRPVVKDGALAIATVMTCTMSCDHRSVDGAVGAQYLAALKPLLEEPLSLML